MSSTVWYISFGKKKISFQKYSAKKSKKIKKTKRKKKILSLFLLFSFILSISLITAGTITDDLHLNIQTTNSTGSVVTGTFDFVFNISTTSDCNNVIYSNSTSLTTDSRGIISYYLPNVTLNYDQQYWLCYYRDGSLINASKIARVPYTFTAKNISAEGIKNDSNLNLRGYNVTGSSGLFTWLGSLSSRITKLFVQDIDFSNNINGSGNITTLGKIGIGTESPIQPLHVIGDANITGTLYADVIAGESLLNVNNSDYLDGYDSTFFMPLNTSVSGNFDFNGGWQNGGLSISAGDIFAQTVYVYNISSLQVNNLNINGSLTPYFNNTFDIGNSSFMWRDFFLGRNAYMLGDVGIGTTTPQQKLTLSSRSNFSVEMETPIGVSASATTGGSLTSGTYYYKVSALDGIGETSASSEVSCTVDGTTTNACNVSWSQVRGASSYRIYNATVSENQTTYFISTITSFLHTGQAIDGSANPPSITTAYVNKLSALGNSWLLGGNLGIGTSTPTTKLHVNGTLNVTNIVLESNCAEGQVLKWSSGGIGVCGNDAIAGYWNLSGNNLYPSSMDYNVGIGTDSPTAKLNVVGTSNFTDNAIFGNNVNITQKLGIGNAVIFEDGDMIFRI